MVGLALLAVVAIAGGIVLATGGDDDHGGPAASTTTTTTARTTTTAAGDPDEAAAKQAVRDYYQAVIDRDCATIIRVSSETVWADAPDETAACQHAIATSEVTDSNYTLVDVVVTGHQGDSITIDAYQQLNETKYLETATVTKRGGVWKIDRLR